MFYQNFSLFQLHRKKRQVWYTGAETNQCSPLTQMNSSCDPTVFFGLFKTKKLLFFFLPKHSISSAAMEMGSQQLNLTLL